MLNQTIFLKPSCFAPEVEMTIPIPDNRDTEEYIDEFLDGILNDDIRFNAEWGFLSMPSKERTWVKIYTSYFARMKNLPADVVPISICSKAPSWYSGIQYKKLAPRFQLVIDYKQTHDSEKYTKCFEKDVLAQLDPKSVVDELTSLSNGKPVALLCYERPDDFCHRHLVAKWLSENGCPCSEFTPAGKTACADTIDVRHTFDKVIG